MGTRRSLCIITENSPNDYMEINESSICTCSSIIKSYSETDDISDFIVCIHTPQIQFPLKDNDNIIELYPYLLTDQSQSGFIRPKYYLYLSEKEEDLDSIILYVKLNQKINEESIESQFKLNSNILSKDVKDLKNEMQKYISDDITIDDILVDGKILDNDVKIDTFLKLDSNQFPNLSINIQYDQKAIKRINYRSILINEIIKTEAQYIENLKYLSEIWAPNLKSKRVLNDQEYDLIFKDIDDIIKCHQQFLESLKGSQCGYSSCVSPSFIEFSNRFHISFSYISSYSQITELLNKKNQNRTFSQALKEISKMNNDNDLQSLLIKPIQRIPQYPLFIERLVKCTPKTHLDYNLISFANEKVNETSNNANMYSDQFKRQTILVQLQNKLKNSSFRIYQPTRKLILYEKLSMIKQKKKYQVTIYVCNDVIFIVKESKLFSKVVFACPSYRFHYISVSGQFRSIHVKYVKSSQKLIEFELIFQNLHDKTMFFDTIQQIEDEIIAIMSKQKIAIWRMDSMSELIPEICEHSSVSNANSIVFGGGTFDMSQKIVNSNFFTYNRDMVNDNYFSQVTSCEMGTMGRRRHTMNYLNNGFIVIGGIGKESEIENIEKFRLQSKNWVIVLPTFPIARYDHTTVFYNDFLWVFGGKSKKYKNIPLFLKVNELSGQIISTDTNGPCPRFGHSACVYRNKMYIFGGSNNSKALLNDLWSYDFDLDKWACEKVSNNGILQPRTHHKSFVIKNQMYIVGGVTSSIISPTICIDLDTLEAFNVTDIGNFPQTIEFTSGGIINDNSTIILYGGIEQKSKNPTSHIYVVKIDCPTFHESTSVESISLTDSKSPNQKLSMNDSSDTYESEKSSNTSSPRISKDSNKEVEVVSLNKDQSLNSFENDGWKSFLNSIPHDSHISYKKTYQPLKRAKSHGLFRKRSNTLTPTRPDSYLNSSSVDENLDSLSQCQTSVQLAMSGITEQVVHELENDNRSIFFDDTEMSESPPKPTRMRQSLFVKNPSSLPDNFGYCEKEVSESTSFSNILSNQSDLSTETSEILEDSVTDRNVQIDIDIDNENSINIEDTDETTKETVNHDELNTDKNINHSKNKSGHDKLDTASKNKNQTKAKLHFEKSKQISKQNKHNIISNNVEIDSNPSFNKSTNKVGLNQSNGQSTKEIDSNQSFNQSTRENIETENNEIDNNAKYRPEIEFDNEETNQMGKKSSKYHKKSHSQRYIDVKDDNNEISINQSDSIAEDNQSDESNSEQNQRTHSQKIKAYKDSTSEDSQYVQQIENVRDFEKSDPVFRIMNKINNEEKLRNEINQSDNKNENPTSTRFRQFPWKKRFIIPPVTSNESPTKKKDSYGLNYEKRKTARKKNDEIAQTEIIDKKLLLNTSRKKYQIAYLPMSFNKTGIVNSERMNLSEDNISLPLESGSPKRRKS